MFKKLFSESSEVSMTRVLSFMCVLTACLIVIYSMHKAIDLNSVAGICSTFLGFGLSAKVIQKQIEVSESSDK